MKTQRKEIVEKEVVIEKINCDICGKQIKEYFYPEENDGGLEIIVRDKKVSYNYGQEGGHSKDYKYDICSKCIEDKIFPYIKELTKKEPRVEESDW